MIDWDKELEAIFADPLFADVTTPKKRQTSSDRLVGGFQQIIEFVEKNNRLPKNCDDRNERKLFNQLQGIINDPAKRNSCLPYDSIGILSKEQEDKASEPETEYVSSHNKGEDTLMDILNDPIFNDVAYNSNLFDIPEYMEKRLEERREADYVAKRVKCEDFSTFESGFKDVQAGLKTGKYRLIKFKDAHIAQGQYFVDDGILVYIAELDQVEKNRHGKKDSRTRCIYENGMESGIYMQTLCKNLYTTGYTVQDVSNLGADFLEKKFSISDNDVESGLIYVIKSLSTNPEISSITDLYKIGFTTIPLKTRIANAKNEPTYLCADVDTVATWKVYNIKSSTFESLIHKLFDGVQLQIKVDGKMPKEWFVVPFNIIEQAINYIISGKSIAYDKNLKQLIDIGEYD